MGEQTNAKKTIEQNINVNYEIMENINTTQSNMIRQFTHKFCKSAI